MTKPFSGKSVLVSGASRGIGRAIAQRFAALDVLHDALDERALLRHRFALSPSVRVVQEHAVTEQGLKLAANRLEFRGGLRYSANLDANVMRMLVDCDGLHPLSTVLQRLAEQLGLDVARAGEIALPVVRHLC